MCGIAGLLEAPGAVVHEPTLRAMGDALAHRGPDAGTTWRGDGSLSHVGLSHRRLSILDHTGGAQPMRSPRSAVTVCFNGQIYNHLALRTALVKDGHAFLSDHSDTEVLVHGMRAWGAGMLERLSGMFAFAIVDERERKLLLARDPMGKKPLYIALPAFFGADRLAFSSELRALEILPGARKQIDERALARFLAFDFVPDPDCIYQGVLKLPPGAFVTFDLDKPASWHSPTIERHNALSFSRAELPASHEDRVVALRKAIADAVDTRMVADVPVGIFLSGGLDSSLVAALAAQRSDKVETFSIAFREPSFDESAFARTVAAHIGARHHEETLDERALLDVVPELAAHLSEPFADHSIVPTFLLSRFTKKHVTVALGGDGGDELFLGYPTFLAERARTGPLDLLARAVDLHRPVGVLLRAAKLLPVSHADLALDFKIQRTLDGLAERDPLRRHQLFLTGANDARMRTLLSARARDALGPDDLLAPLDEIAREARDAGARDAFDVLQVGYMRTYMAAGVLQKVDRASMAASLEVRAPLLDKRVVDLALALPAADKLRGFRTKAILKDVATGLIPDSIIHRRKKGFGMPVASWLCGPLRPMVEELLSPSAVAADGLLDERAVSTVVSEHLSKRRNHRKTLWALFMYRLWRTRGQR
jgi:asparagine synthase (glutamine-hydrolysing)